MKRFFNTTGLCNPDDHYMVDPFRGMFDSIYQLIESKQFFLLHAPRQTGKTTFLHELAHRLNREGKYISVAFSLESEGTPKDIEIIEIEKLFIESLYEAASKFIDNNELPPSPNNFQSSHALFQNYLFKWAERQVKPIVLLIDDLDALRIDIIPPFLAQIRDGFQCRPERFPGTIAFTGLHKIGEYQNRAKEGLNIPDSGPPFNILASSFFLPAFSKEEVRSLLLQHTDDTGQVFSPEVMDKLYEYSGGQPWLTNALANEIVREILGNDFSKPITPELVELAKENLIAERQTHLDSLADKVNEGRVRRVVMSIISGDTLNFDGYDDAIRYCRDLGIVTQTNPVQFANPIYREIVTRILNSSLHDSFNQELVETVWYVRPDGTLDMDKLLHAFVDFYRWNAESWLERYQYKEAGHQLLLMAFLQRIVNGGGRIEREMAVGNGRTDLAVFWKNQVFALELKINRNARSQEEGLRQISRYLDKLGQKAGYLILFETRSSEEIPWEQRLGWEVREYEGKQITLVKL